MSREQEQAYLAVRTVLQGFAPSPQWSPSQLERNLKNIFASSLNRHEILWADLEEANELVEQILILTPVVEGLSNFNEHDLAHLLEVLQVSDLAQLQAEARFMAQVIELFIKPISPGFVFKLEI